MDLPKVRRWRKGNFDLLYVYDRDQRTLGWASTMTGDITVQIPGSEARIEAALNVWADMFPEDDLAQHRPGRHTSSLARMWQTEIDAISQEITELEGMRRSAEFQRDQYVKGTHGELTAGEALNKLYKSGWGILHSIPVYDSAADIDHLLIGPGGVWTVNAKAHPAQHVIIDGDTIRIGRTKVDYVNAARREAAMVESVLADHDCRVSATPAIILDMPKRTTVHAIRAPVGVRIMFLPQAIQAIRGSTDALSPREVAEIFDVARRLSTWETQTNA